MIQIQPENEKKYLLIMMLCSFNRNITQYIMYHTCQLFENFMGENAQKWPFSTAF